MEQSTVINCDNEEELSPKKLTMYRRAEFEAEWNGYSRKFTIILPKLSLKDKEAASIYGSILWSV